MLISKEKMILTILVEPTIAKTTSPINAVIIRENAAERKTTFLLLIFSPSASSVFLLYINVKISSIEMIYMTSKVTIMLIGYTLLIKGVRMYDLFGFMDQLTKEVKEKKPKNCNFFTVKLGIRSITLLFMSQP